MKGETRLSLKTILRFILNYFPLEKYNLYDEEKEFQAAVRIFPQG